MSGKILTHIFLDYSIFESSCFCCPLLSLLTLTFLTCIKTFYFSPSSSLVFILTTYGSHSFDLRLQFPRFSVVDWGDHSESVTTTDQTPSIPTSRPLLTPLTKLSVIFRVNLGTWERRERRWVQVRSQGGVGRSYGLRMIRHLFNLTSPRCWSYGRGLLHLHVFFSQTRVHIYNFVF